MATAKRVFHQIELNFWNLAIPLLSDTVELQQLVRFVGSLIAKYHKLHHLPRSLMWASAGGLLGLLMGICSGLIFR